MDKSRWAPKPEDAVDAAAMDEFAQTREPDNLFDDDFTPVAEPVAQTVPPEAPRHSTTQFRSPRDGAGLAERGSHRGGRGRGRGRGNSGAPDRPPPPRNAPQVSSSKQDAASAAVDKPSDPAPAAAEPGAAKDSAAGAEPAATADAVVTSAATDANTAATPVDEASAGVDEPVVSGEAAGGAEARPKPPPAVRGDRTGTGGVPKPKLTEAELSARLEAARLNAVRREAAHAAASADEAEFLAREAAATVRRREETVARQAQDAERERNRVRKMRGQREWDEGKNEEDFAPRGGRRGRGDYSRGEGYRRGGGDLPRGEGYGRGGGDFYARGERGASRRARGGRIIEYGRGTRGAPAEAADELGLGEIEVGEDAFSKDAFSQARATAPEGRGRGRGKGRGRSEPTAGRGGKLDFGTEEFPALQTIPKPAGDGTKDPETGAESKHADKPEPKRMDSLMSPTDKTTWADQMDASAAAAAS